MAEEFSPQRVLITGAAGAVGSVLRAGLRGCYDHLRLTDIAELGEATAGEELIPADILDQRSLDAAMADVDCVVHLAGIADEDCWDRVLALAIDGCYSVFEAARHAGVRRLVYASSNHAIGFYPREWYTESRIMTGISGITPKWAGSAIDRKTMRKTSLTRS